MVHDPVEKMPRPKFFSENIWLRSFVDEFDQKI